MSTNPRIGVEVELLPVNRATLDRPLCDGWEPGWDGYNAEYRTSRVRYLDSFTDHVQTLMSRLNERREQWALNRETGFHVHINTNGTRHSTTRLGLIAAYQHMFDDARSLVENPAWRLGQRGGLAPYNSLINLEDYWRNVRFSREFVPNSLGTMELRLWDATFDMDLIAMRHSFLRRLVALAEEINTDEAAQLLLEGITRQQADEARTRRRQGRYSNFYSPAPALPTALLNNYLTYGR